MAWPTKEEREFWRHRCRDSFWWFFRYAYGYDFNPEGELGKRWLREETHRDAFDWFERLVKPWLAARARGEQYALRLAIVVPRDWGKTTIFTQAGLLWLHLHDPDISTYIGSENQQKSVKWLNPITKVINGKDKSSRFAWLYGNGEDPTRDAMWKREGLVTAYRNNLTKTTPSFWTWGVEQGITGDHPDAGSLDDPTSYEKMQTNSDWLQTVNLHHASLIPVFQTGSLLMYVGTRYADLDHFGFVFKNEGIASINGKTIAEDGKPYIAKLPDYRPSPTGTWHVYYLSGEEPRTKRLTMPHIWPRWKIDNLDAVNPPRCAAQVRNDPTTNALTPITEDECRRCVRGVKKDYNWKRMLITMHMDTAFKTPARVGKGDETVLQAWGHEQDGSGRLVYWGGWGDNRMNGDQMRELVFQTTEDLLAAGCFVRCITDETEAGGKSGVWESLLRSRFAEAKKHMPEFMYIYRQSTDGAKYKRMCEAAGFWKRGYVTLPEDAPGLEPLIRQMSRIGSSHNKDWADVAADPFHKQVYVALQAVPNAAPISFLNNPFDDIMKPGLEGEIAADKVAEFYEQQEEAMRMWDPIS